MSKTQRRNSKPRSQLYEDAWSFFDRLVAATSEEQVVRLLVQSHTLARFSNSRYYDVNVCPFDHIHFYVLRDASRVYSRAAPGYMIYEPTMTESLLVEGEPIWESTNDPAVIANEQKQKWISDLELAGSGWLDIPIVAGPNVFGLWTLDREANDLPTPTEKELVRRLATVAALRIVDLRAEKSQALAAEMPSLYFDSVDARDSIAGFLSKVCKTLNAGCVAYFAYDPVCRALNKVVEVYQDGSTVRRVEDQKVDLKYNVGSCLTGNAWTNESLHHIADFARLSLKMPGLAEKNSQMLHERLLSAPLRSVIYERIDVPGGIPGLIRVFNRVDDSRMTLTNEHRGILRRISFLFGQALSVNDSINRIRAVWGAFSQTLERLRKDGLQYQAIAGAAEGVGISQMLVTVWSRDGTYIDGWSNDSPVDGELRKILRAVPSKWITGLEHPEVQRVSMLPDEIKKLLESFDIKWIYIVPSHENVPERSDPHITLTIFTLQKWSTDATKSSISSEDGDFWNARPGILITLDILGRLTGNARELARNRSLLYLAETAVGMIGHEMRSDAAGVVSLSEELCELTKQLIEQVREGRPISLVALETEADPHGDLLVKTLSDFRDVHNWIVRNEAKLGIYSHQMLRVIDSALRWARMGGRIIEMQLEKISLAAIVRECIGQFRRELNDRPRLHIIIKDGVHKLPLFVADRFLIHNLIINLLDNAIKYSHERKGDYKSEVIISGELQRYFVEISITNWGLGIDESDYNSVFSPFFRSSVRDRLHTVRGVGLGLSECKKIVSLHRGSIRVKSVPTLNDWQRSRVKEGYLTTFTVRLPTSLKEGRIDVDTTKSFA